MSAIRIFVLLFLAGCATSLSPQAGTDSSRPIYLWDVSNPEGQPVGWLFGSMHAAAEPKVDPAVLQALDAAKAVVFEIDMSPEGLREASIEAVKRSQYPAGETLADHVSAELLTKVRRAVAQGRFGPELQEAPAVAESMRPWVLAMTLLTTPPPQSEGQVTMENGLDAALASSAQGTKTFEALETAAEQLDLFANMAPDLAQQMLAELIDAAQATQDAFTALHRAYRDGDDDALGELLEQGRQQSESSRAFMETTFDQRNQRMAQTLAARFEPSTPRLVVVGVGHLLGPRGIPALLRDKGFQLTRRTVTGDLVRIEPSPEAVKAKEELDLSGSVTVTFPGTAERSTHPTGDGEVVRLHYVDAERNVYMLTKVKSSPPASTTEAVALYLGQTMQGAAQALGGTLGTCDERPVERLPALRCIVQGTPMWTLVRMVSAGGFLYSAIFMATQENLRQGQSYLESMRVTP